MIFILSGPSGSGKTTLRDLLLKDRSVKNKFVKSVSFSTRPRRPGEKEGRDYFFVSRAEFFRLKRARKILEWTKYLGYYYGTKKELVENALKKGKHVMLCLDFKGMRRLKKIYPKETKAIFIIPPSIKELHKRIKGRSLETKDEEIGRRVNLARKELENVSLYDFTISNVNLKQAVKGLRDIVLKKSCLK